MPIPKQVLAVLAFSLVLAACGKEESPAEAPVADATPEPAVEQPKPAEGFTTEAPASSPIISAPSTAAPVVREVTQMSAPNLANHEDRRLRKAVEEIPATLIGGIVADVSEEEAPQRAFRALYNYLDRKNIPKESFYLKYFDKDAGYWTFMFFGVPTAGEGLYVYVRLFPDGRAEIVD